MALFVAAVPIVKWNMPVVHSAIEQAGSKIIFVASLGNLLFTTQTILSSMLLPEAKLSNLFFHIHHLDMKNTKTFTLSWLAALAICFTGSMTAVAQNSIQDADNDTRVETARTGDDDVIRLRVGGVDRLQLRDQRFEPLNNGSSIFIGVDAGRDDDLSTNFNSFIGSLAGQRNVNGALNTAIGASALRLNINNSNNTAIGPSALLSLSAGTANNANTAIGPRSLDALTGGASNAAIGTDAGGKLITGSGNLMIGHATGANKTGGDFNTLLGSGAGSNNGVGSNNVMIGYLAGANETGSDKLYISNSATATPLIQGDFAAGTLDINGKTSIRGGTTLAQDIYGSSTGAVTRYYAANGDFRGLVGNLFSSRFSVRAATDDDLRFETGTSSRMHIDGTSGDIGIGTNTPEAQLHVAGAGGATNPQLQLTQTGSSQFNRLRFNDSNFPTNYFDVAVNTQGSGNTPEMNFFYTDGTTSENIMTIEGFDRQVGIGTTNPTNAKLVINSNGNTSQAQLRLVEDEGVGYVRMEFDNDGDGTNSRWQVQARSGDGTNTSTTDARWQLTHSSDGSTTNENIIFHVDGDDQRIGINNEFPTADLHVGSTTGATIQMGSAEEISDGGAFQIAVNSDIRPTVSGSVDLGISTLEWRNLYLSGSVLFAPPGGGTSSRGADFKYGLDEVLALRPASYDVNGSTKLSIDPSSMAGSISELYVTETEKFSESEDGSERSSTTKALENPAVNTLDLIPVLVKAIQEQNEEVAQLREENAELMEQVDQLAAFGTASDEIAGMLADMERTKREIEQLKADLTSCCMNAQGPGIDPAGNTPATGVLAPTSLEMPTLEQNTPNPFHTDTQIRYYLPEGSTGEIVVADQLGRVLSTQQAQPGVNFVRIEGGALAAGSYRYTLVVDGVTVDTKQMVLTR